jgi:hypothetical protein
MGDLSRKVMAHKRPTGRGAGKNEGDEGDRASDREVVVVAEAAAATSERETWQLRLTAALPYSIVQ